MKKILVIALAASMFAAAGCTTLGDQSLAATDKATVDRYIVDGKTTMADVRAVFGETKSKEQTKAGGEFWYYSAVNQRFVTATIKTLGITFNDKGIVTSHRYGESAPNVATSLK